MTRTIAPDLPPPVIPQNYDDCMVRVHAMKQTAMKDEYDRGDIKCPNCDRNGPNRYTGHMYCTKCKFCTFCTLVNPICKPPSKEMDELDAWDDDDFVPEDEQTPEQRARIEAKKAAVLLAQQQAEDCACDTTAGAAALDSFYAWQEKIMMAR
jgi:hypothetical protein